MTNDTDRSEHEEQRDLVARWRRIYPEIRIMAIPNGGHRHIAVAQRLRAEGVTAGVPDLYIPAWRIWIELKRRSGGRVSPAQRDWHDYLRGCGDTVIVAAGADDALEQVAALKEC